MPSRSLAYKQARSAITARRLVLAFGGTAGAAAVVAGLAGFHRVAGVAAAILLISFLLATWITDPESAFNEVEARAMLRRELEAWEALAWEELRDRIGTIETPEVIGAKGTRYQIEIEVVWDAAPGGAIRVLGAIDDGGVRAFFPVTHGLLVAPDV